ncbi:molybdopterin-guanine dinucleotide biosynthesis protein B [Anaerobacillus arseniciselenatis]|uniref:Molybdopterin-guanine dinucleotide biosynthesis protein B n=1 Tax=Anaerobacillus arseniciselenatis TaxID=85682 RepID=A0A1S2LCT5_9BACI|nr:molybdopterin-guanine dinucleotide biosynthesis protein B [Anaerobacillus arseniciselenatis]OIJ10176.1 molybdopterin-guanine dinucleotide biosynthesis protein B [Anaerobacillus arseniciselenatis]
MTQQMIQVAGFSNSGKTTLVEKLVICFTKENFKVGTLKHHGHGGELISLDYGKDSWKHRKAGAVVSGAVSKGELQLNVLNEQSWEPTELVDLYKNFPIDVLVIEGFKASPFPKIVLIKQADDLILLSKLENIFCVISWITLPKEVQSDSIRYYRIEEEEKYLQFILQKLKGQDNE